MLARPDGHEAISELLEATEQVLLRYRLHELGKALREPQTVARELDESRTRVEWQLWRVYRARNLLAHDGVEAPHLPQLVDHLHYYLSTVLSKLMHGVATRESWEPGDSAHHWISHAHYVVDQLRRAPEALRVDDFILGRRDDQTRVWPTS